MNQRKAQLKTPRFYLTPPIHMCFSLWRVVRLLEQRTQLSQCPSQVATKSLFRAYVLRRGTVRPPWTISRFCGASWSPELSRLLLIVRNAAFVSASFSGGAWLHCFPEPVGFFALLAGILCSSEERLESFCSTFRWILRLRSLRDSCFLHCVSSLPQYHPGGGGAWLQRQSSFQRSYANSS